MVLREASTAAQRDVEGPTPDWWPPAEHNVQAADLRMTRASTAAPRDSPVRLSDGAADESSGWVYQVVADTGIEAGSVGLNRCAREDMGFGLGATPTVRRWQPTPDHALATLRFSCAPTTPLAAGEKFRIDERQLCAFLARYYTVLVIRKN